MRSRLIWNTNKTTGWEPLVIDLSPPTPGVWWICTMCSVLGQFANNVPRLNPSPCVGFYLVQRGRATESLADAQAGWNSDARGIILPSDLAAIDMGPTAGYPFAGWVHAAARIMIPGDSFLRFIASANPGTTQPGPGAGSFGTLSAQVETESSLTP